MLAVEVEEKSQVDGVLEMLTKMAEQVKKVVEERYEGDSVRFKEVRESNTKGYIKIQYVAEDDDPDGEEAFPIYHLYANGFIEAFRGNSKKSYPIVTLVNSETEEISPVHNKAEVIAAVISF